MAWNLSSVLRAKWLRGWKRHCPRTILRGKPALELLEERNPPSSVLVGGMAGGGGAGRTGSTGAPTSSPSTSGTSGTSAPATAPAAGAATPSSSSASSGKSTGNNASAPSSNPFSDPLADPLGATRSKPPAGGGGGASGASTGSGGGLSGSGAVAPNPTAAGPTPVATSNGSSGNDLWQAANVPGGKRSTPAPSSASSLQATATNAPSPQSAWLRQSVAALPQVFEPNVGQAASGVAFVAQGFGSSVALKPQEMDLTVQSQSRSTSPTALSFQLVGANATAHAVTGSLLNSRSNYFGGNSSQWHSNVANYRSVTFTGIYQGIDVSYYANSAGRLEYDYTIAPGANPAQLRFRVQGADSVSLDSQGNLLLHTAAGTVTQSLPSSYQNTSTGHSTISGTYVLNADGTIGYSAGAYDTTKPLIVDPSISYSTLLASATPEAIAVDGLGATYIAGTTAAPLGGDEAFLTKLSTTGSTIFTNYLFDSSGQHHNVDGTGIAIDAAGNAYVAGWTQASGFPTSSGAYKTTLLGYRDNFVAKFNATGDALLYSTLLDGSAGAYSTAGTAVAVDEYGHAYAVGTTTNASFPTTVGAFQTTFGGGTQQAFVVELTADGSGAVYSSDLGGAGNAFATGVAVDASGAAYIGGHTDGNFPTTMGAYQTTFVGSTDGFVTKVSPGGASKAYSTLLRGSDTPGTSITAIAVDPIKGLAYVTGDTQSLIGFPTTGGAFQPTNPSTDSAFVTAFNPAGTGLVYSTFLGGSSSTTFGDGIALAPDGTAWVTGNTGASNFPTQNPTQSSYGGAANDGFLTHLKSDGTGLLFSTFAGGDGADFSYAVAVDALGSAYIIGVSGSDNFPYPGGIGAEGAFVQKYGAAPPAPAITSISPDTGFSSTDQITTSQTITLSGTALPSATITLSRSDLGVLPNPVTADSLGNWTYNYSGTTLSEGAYDFTATQTKSGATSDPTADFLVTVDRTAPTVNLAVPATVDSLSPVVTVTASDLIGLPPSAAVTLDVDLNNDGNFSDTHETGNATATLTNGYAAVPLNYITTTGTYRVRARVTDLAGNEGTSATDTFTVSSSGSSSITQAWVQDSDPLTGQPREALGNVQLNHALDLDRSPGTAQSGNTALTYNSRSVAQLPIVQASIQTDNSQALPAHVIAQLTWNNAVQGATTYSTSGFHPGDLLTVAQQASSAATTTGRYPWSLQLTLDYGTPLVLTASGTTFVAAQDNSPFGAGWTLSSVVSLPEMFAGFAA
jgi:hypothetical protein